MKRPEPRLRFRPIEKPTQDLGQLRVPAHPQQIHLEILDEANAVFVADIAAHRAARRHRIGGGRHFPLLGSSTVGVAASFPTMLSRRQWTPDSALLLVMWFFTGLAGASLCALLAQYLTRSLPHGTQMFYVQLAGTLPMYACAGGVFIWFLRSNRLGWNDSFGLRRRWGRAVLVAVGAAILVLPLARGLLWVSQHLLEWCSVELVTQTPVEAVRAVPALWQKLVLGALAVLGAPVLEEMFFRGILYPTIKQAGFPRLALWGTALFFAVSHANLMAFLPLTFFGLVLALLYEATDNLLAPITTHALFNAVNLVMLLVETGNR
jgi:membrane protease YdiL (CAAX protease family)